MFNIVYFWLGVAAETEGTAAAEGEFLTEFGRYYYYYLPTCDIIYFYICSFWLLYFLRSSKKTTTKHLLCGAADLILLERMATVEEECSNALDREEILREENVVIQSQLSVSREGAKSTGERAARAEKL
jgi:hypothetical protein